MDNRPDGGLAPTIVGCKILHRGIDRDGVGEMSKYGHLFHSEPPILHAMLDEAEHLCENLSTKYRIGNETHTFILKRLFQ